MLKLVACIHFAKFHFPLKYLTGADILFIKLELYCTLASKKKSIPDWHLYITQMETKLTLKWYAMISHVIAYRSTELLFGTHTFNFSCFFDDFNCVFTQIRCLSRLLFNIWKSPTVATFYADNSYFSLLFPNFYPYFSLLFC